MAGLLASTAVAVGVTTLPPKGVIPFPEPFKSECRALRAEVYPRYHANGDQYLPGDFEKLVAFRDRVNAVMQIDYSNFHYSFDMYSCAWFDNTVKGGQKEYRNANKQ